MDRQEVGGRADLRDRRHEHHPHLCGTPGGDVRIVGDQVHAERAGALGDQRAHAAEADDPQGLRVELNALPPLSLPGARGERGVSLGEVASLREEQRHRVLGRGQNVRLGSVHHENAMTGGGLDIHVVQSDARPAHDLEVLGALQEGRVDLRCRADNERVVSLDDRSQLFG